MVKVKKYTRVVFALATLLAAQSFVSAATVWTGATADNKYATAGNWSDGVPSPTNPGTVNTNVTFSGDTSLANSTTLTFNGGSTCTLGSTFQFYNGTVVNIGDENGGTATVSASGMTQFHGSLSENTPSIMNVCTGSSYTANSYMLLGNGDNQYGILNVNGGTATMNASSFTIGDNGTGVVNVNSGTLNVNCTFEIANHGTAKGTVNQNGGTVAATRDFRVGGGDSTASGNQPNTGTYNFYAGTLTSSNTIQVGFGNGATGTFNVKQGANLQNAPAMSIGAQYNAKCSRPTGYLILEAGKDASHKTQMSTSKTLNVGDLTNGTMTINANSVFTSTGTTTIGTAASGIGIIDLKEGGEATFGTLKIGVNGSGELKIAKGSTPTFNKVLIGAGNGTGTLTVPQDVTLTIPSFEPLSDGNLSEAHTYTGTANVNVNAGGTLTTTDSLIGPDGSGTKITVAGTWNSNHQLTFYCGTADLTGDAVLKVTLPRDAAGKFYQSSIGKDGKATLNVKEHAQFNFKWGTDGGQTGLEWDNVLYIGQNNNGNGEVIYSSDQASTWEGNVRVASGGGSQGTIKVTNGTITQTGSHFLLGQSGKATLEVSGTGKMSIGCTTYVGDATGSATSPGKIGADITVKDSGQLTMSALYLSDKNYTYGNLNVTGADAQLKVNNILRVGCHQNYTGINNDQGGTGTFVVDGNKKTSVGYFKMGNQIAQSSLTVKDGEFKTTMKSDAAHDYSNYVYGNSYITLSNSTMTLADKLTLNDTASLTLSGGSTLSGTSLTLAGSNNIYSDGLGNSIKLTGDLTFADGQNTSMTIYLEDPYAESKDYKLIDALSTTGTLESLTLVSPIGTQTIPGNSKFLDYTNGLSLTYDPSIAPLPEPATWALLLLGLAGITALRKKMNNE